MFPLKSLIFFIFLSSSLLSFTKMESFSADFRQIIDSGDSQIVYSGRIEAKRPNRVVWHYKEPVEKSLYIDGDRVYVIDHDLEQVIIKMLNSEVLFFSILENSKKIDEKRYSTSIGEQNYLLIVDKNSKNSLKKIIYVDQLDNSIEINFFDSVIDKELNNSLFEPKIPNSYDKIYQ